MICTICRDPEVGSPDLQSGLFPRSLRSTVYLEISMHKIPELVLEGNEAHLAASRLLR